MIRLGKINFANSIMYPEIGDLLILPHLSITSLIKIILALKDIRVDIQQFGAQMPELKPGEAALLIGDSALRAVGRYRIIAEIGNEWKKLTGRKMVYAVWAVRKEYARDEPGNVKYTLDCLLKSKEYASSHVDEIAGALSRSKAISVDFMNEYLHTLNYDFDKESRESLELYFKCAKKLGIIRNEVPLRFFGR